MLSHDIVIFVLMVSYVEWFLMVRCHILTKKKKTLSDLFLVHRHEGGHDVNWHWEDDGAVVLC